MPDITQKQHVLPEGSGGIIRASARSIGLALLLVLAGLPFAPEATAQPSRLFNEVSEEAGVAFRHISSLDSLQGATLGISLGAAWFDFDRDGDLDLYASQGDSLAPTDAPNLLFRNNGDGTFDEVAQALGAADPFHNGGAVAVADYDNDGWLDLYLANADADVLLKNDGGTRFIDVTAGSGLEASGDNRGSTASWGDYDNDGLLDLYVANHTHLGGHDFSRQDFLFHNNGDGTFSDVSALLGLDNLDGYGFIGGWTDFDDDGDLDIFLVNDCPFNELIEPTRLFRNDGGTDPLAWQFTEVADLFYAAIAKRVEEEPNTCHNGMGLAVGDYNRDGRMDYFYTNIGQTLLLQNQGGAFIDRTEEAGVGISDDSVYPWTWGANFFDFNNDTWLDLYVTAGGLQINRGNVGDEMANYLFRANGDGRTFEDVSFRSGVNTDKRSRTSITGDYDGDGDLDLFLLNVNEDALLFRNDDNSGNHYLFVELEGTQSNRDGIGARLKVTTPDGVVQYAETRSGSSVGGGDALPAHFGLGSNTEVTSLEIRWPSGEVQVLTGLAADQTLQVVEPGGPTAVEPEMPEGATALDALYPNPFAENLSIGFHLARPEAVMLTIHDVLGREVRRLADALLAPGAHRLTWDGRDAAQHRLAPGLYFVRLRAGATLHTQPVLFQR